MTEAVAGAGPAPSSAVRGHWSTVLYCVLGVAVCSTPMSVLSLSVFFVPFGELFGWGRHDSAAALSIWALVMAVTTPFAGRLIDRIGVKAVLMPSLLGYAACLAATPFLIDRFGLMGLYAAYVGIGVLGAGSNNVAYAHILTGWFNKTRGLVLGFAMGGIAVGAIIGPWVATYMLQHYSWREAFFGLAALPVVIGLPLALFLVREAPRAAQAQKQNTITSGMSGAEAFKTSTFWILFFVFLIVATFLHGAQLHLIPLMSDRGLSSEGAVSTFSLLFAVTAITRVAAGFLFDRFFAPRIGAVLFLTSAVGAAMLIPEWAPVYYFAAAALLGIGTGAETDLLGYVASRYFGKRAFGEVYGGLFAAFMIGSAVGPYIYGYGFDAAGSYTAVLYASVVGLVVACGLLAMLPKYPPLEEAAATKAA